MALASLGPWNTPPNYLGAIESGARIGLAARESDERERELDLRNQQVADRLALAYDTLGQRERLAAGALQSKMELANAQLGMRQQILDMAQQRHDENLGLRRDMFENTMKHQADVMAQREQRMQDMADYRDRLAAQRERNIHFGPQGQVLQIMPDNSVKVLREPDERPGREPTFTMPISPGDPMGPKISGPLSDPEIRRRFDEATANALKVTPPPESGFSKLKRGLSNLFAQTPAGAGTNTAPAIAPTATNMAPGVPTPPVPTSPLGPPAPSQSPYKEGALLRGKKGTSQEGKQFRIINGIPVEVVDSNQD